MCFAYFLSIFMNACVETSKLHLTHIPAHQWGADVGSEALGQRLARRDLVLPLGQCITHIWLIYHAPSGIGGE